MKKPRIQINKLAPSRYEVRLVQRDDNWDDAGYSVNGEGKTLKAAIEIAQWVSGRNGGLGITRPSTASEKRATNKVW